jgi:hypothetical protein
MYYTTYNSTHNKKKYQTHYYQYPYLIKKTQNVLFTVLLIRTMTCNFKLSVNVLRASYETGFFSGSDILSIKFTSAILITLEFMYTACCQ